MKITTLFILLFGLSIQIAGQEIIELENPSFEGQSHIRGVIPNNGAGFIIEGWKDCRLDRDSPLEGPPAKWFGTDVDPAHGNTYLGLVGDADGTYKSVCSVLSSSMEEGRVYKFSLLLCRSETYSMARKGSRIRTRYITPMVLRIYGGFTHCQKLQKLGETVPVDHTDWGVYEFLFKPWTDYTHLTFEAYYDTSVAYPYNGNLLMDDCSSLRKISFEPFPDLLWDIVEEEEMENLIIDYGKKNFEEFTGEETFIPVHMMILYNIWKFEDSYYKMGIRQYLMNTPMQDLSVAIKCLEASGAQKTLSVLKKLILIKNKNGVGLTEEEVGFFENSEEVFEKTLIEEFLDEKRKIYVKNNREALIREMKNL